MQKKNVKIALLCIVCVLGCACEGVYLCVCVYLLAYLQLSLRTEVTIDNGENLEKY